MKTLWNFILLMGLVCLAGCSEEDPQSVAFGVKEITVGSQPSRNRITIIANCPWTITEESNMIFVEDKEGEGPMENVLVATTNLDYETKRYIVKITSEDGTSSDILTVTQEEAIGLKVGSIGQISEEGNTIDIPVKTNEPSLSVDYPEWMSLISSRALKDCTYTFSVEPNKTGSPRKGVVRFRGKETDESINVTQDSYAPTGVDLSTIPDMIPVVLSYETWVPEPVSYPLVVIPEYADPSKLSIVSQIPAMSKADISDKTVTFSFPGTQGGFGYQHLTFFFISDGKEIASKRVELVKGQINVSKKRLELYLGEEFEIGIGAPEKYYTTKLSDESAISVLGKNKFRAEKTGEYTIRFINNVSLLPTDVSISIRDYIMKSYMSYSYDWGTLWNVEIVGEFRANNITEYTTGFIDGNRNLQLLLNKDSQKVAKTDNLINKFNFIISAQDRNELEYKISKFKFFAGGVMDGRVFSIAIPVNPKQP